MLSVPAGSDQEKSDNYLSILNDNVQDYLGHWNQRIDALELNNGSISTCNMSKNVGEADNNQRTLVFDTSAPNESDLQIGKCDGVKA